MRFQNSLGRLSSCSTELVRSPLLRSLQTASTSTTLSDSPGPSSSLSSNSSSRSSIPSSAAPKSTLLNYRHLLQSCSKIFADDTPLKSTVWRNRLSEAEQTLNPDEKRRTRIAGMCIWRVEKKSAWLFAVVLMHLPILHLQSSELHILAQPI